MISTGQLHQIPYELPEEEITKSELLEIEFLELKKLQEQLKDVI